MLATCRALVSVVYMAAEYYCKLTLFIDPFSEELF